MGSSPNSFGKPVYDDSYDLPTDLQTVADFAEDGFWTRGGTSVQRQATPTGRLKAGMIWRETDTGLQFQWNGTVWTSLTHRISMRRSATPVQIAANKYDNLSTSAYWVEAHRHRFEAYADGIVIPATGVYRVGYRLRSSGALLAGLTVNTPTVGTLDAMLLQASSGVGVAGNFVLSTAGQLALNQGDLVRLFAIGAAITPWNASAAGSAFEAELIP